MKNNILIVGSRSGGHILPGLVKAREWYNTGSHVYLVAEDRQLDRSLLEREAWLQGIYFLKLSSPIQRAWWKYPLYAASCLMSVIRMIMLLRRWNISCVKGMGGYSSVPVCIAAALLGIPYDLYEFNAELGRAVYWLRHKARAIICCFPQALQYVPVKARTLEAYPLRYSSHDVKNAQKARVALGLDPNRYTLCILGGSQGSHALNELVITWLTKHTAVCSKQLQVIHQTGSQRECVSNFYQRSGIHACVFDYRDNLADVYCAADYIVTRAGAGILHEIMHFDKCALIVPLETVATHHQVSNGQAMEHYDSTKWKMVRQVDREELYAALDKQLPKD